MLDWIDSTVSQRARFDHAAFDALAERCRADDPHYLGTRCADLSRMPHRLFLQHDHRGRPVARVAAMVGGRDDNGGPVGMLGLYEAVAGTDPSLMQVMLDAACGYLRRQRCGFVVGPMNGSTWHDYRFALPGGGQPFFLDVHHPPAYLNHWLAAGFKPVERYVSSVIERERFSFSRLERCSRRMANRGVSVCEIGAADLQTVLPGIHALCLDAFAANPLFQPIGFDEFAELYRPAEQLIDGRWALTARDDDGQLLGFAFAFPDLFDEAHRGLVIKTVAVGRHARARGVGAWLTEMLHQRAYEAGMDRVFHALMHERNQSTNVLGHSASDYRRYALLGRAL